MTEQPIEGHQFAVPVQIWCTVYATSEDAARAKLGHHLAQWFAQPLDPPDVDIAGSYNHIEDTFVAVDVLDFQPNALMYLGTNPDAEYEGPEYESCALCDPQP